MGVEVAIRPVRRILGRARHFVRDRLARHLSGRFRAFTWLELLNHDGFRRELRAVAAGYRAYLTSTESESPTQYRLRRNVHRIEKGLIHTPRRSSFAGDYIEETVDAFEKVLRGSRNQVRFGTELAWARDVLLEYFSSTGSHPARDRAQATFDRLIRDGATEAHLSTGLTPYSRAAERLDARGVEYKAFLDLTRQRRSVRWFEQKPVPREMVDKALLAAAQAPSACNRQPFEFRIFDEPNLVRRVAAIPGGTVGFHENFPAIAVVIGDLGAFFSSRDRHVIYIDASLAAMSFMLALETLGLSSCPINWPDVNDAEMQMRRLLNLTENERIVMLIAFGYSDPDGLIARSQKKSLDLLRRYNAIE